jgi:hypothetical protein
MSASSQDELKVLFVWMLVSDDDFYLKKIYICVCALFYFDDKKKQNKKTKQKGRPQSLVAWIH